MPELPRVVQLPDGRYVYADPANLPAIPTMPVAGPQIVHQHIHQAPPDRTLQRAALGAGAGGGTVAAGVYFGPLLVGAMTSIAISLAIAALVVGIICWTLVQIVRSVGGPEGQAAAETIGKARKRG
ncbi:DUF6251 family protein [Streptomyces sp. NPDC018031]|uniref:DUF6251 family protein n=1 Tax=Streptomyces sp. NPDC018031 TaxID=3365033 RepID=UPI0037BD0373